MINLQYLMFLPIAVGLFLFLIPESLKLIKGIINLIISAIVLYYSILVFKMDSLIISMSCFI